MYENIVIGVGIISIYFLIKCTCTQKIQDTTHIMFKGSYYPH